MSGWIRPGIGRMVQRMLAEIPGLRIDFADVLPETDGVVDRFVPPQPRLTRKVLTAPARILPRDPPLPTRRSGPRPAVRPLRPARCASSPRSTCARSAGPSCCQVAAARARRRGPDHRPARGLPAPGRASTCCGCARCRRCSAAVDRSGLIARRAHPHRGRQPRLRGPRRARTRRRGAARGFGLDAAGARGADRAGRPVRRVPRRAARRSSTSTATARRSSPLLMSAPTWGDAPATVLGHGRRSWSRTPPRAGRADRGAAGRTAAARPPLVALTRSGRGCAAQLASAARRRSPSARTPTSTAPACCRCCAARVLEAGRRLAEAGVLRERGRRPAPAPGGAGGPRATRHLAPADAERAAGRWCAAARRGAPSWRACR